MNIRICTALMFLLLLSGIRSVAQSKLAITTSTGLRAIVVQEDYPLLKLLLPGQPDSDRGIEIEFPEHVTGLNKTNNQFEHLYLTTRGSANKRTLPVWRKEGNKLIYKTDLDDKVTMIATASLSSDGISYTYSFVNHSKVSYEKFQAVTCVKLYSLFSDTLLQRTYVHHADGFDLLASETPERLTMPLQKWLPCRYLVSYSWPVYVKRIEKDEDGITRYHKSRKVDKPFIATLSHNKAWIAATYTKETGNLWTNPERSCQHLDPSVSLNAGERKSMSLKTFVIKGNLKQLLQIVNR